LEISFISEITGNTAKHERHIIDLVMFFIALVLAPLIVTALTFWIFLVPVVALAMGGPVYLLLGIPLLLWWLSRKPPKPNEIAWLAFCANLAVASGPYAFMALTGAAEPEFLALLYLIFGCIFAPLWAWTFGKLYLSLRRPFFAQTV
jgi:hypothetical protein